MKLLKLESWKIFTLMIPIPIVFLTTGVFIQKQTGLDLKIATALLASFTMLFTYLSWIWSAGVTFNKLAETNTKISVTTFKYLIITSTLISFVLIPIIRIALEGRYSSIFRIANLFSFSLFLLAIYFVSDKFSSIKSPKTNSTNSKSFVFFCIWLLPFGIWFIQPKIKDLMTENK